MDINEAPKSTQDRINKLLSDAEEQKKRNWKYYEKIRKDDKKGYLSTNNLVQMNKDAEDLGDAFYA